MSAQRDPLYLVQVQPDWHIPLQHRTILDLPSSLHLTGGNHGIYDLLLPNEQDSGVSKIWTNITRVDPNNEKDIIFHNIMIDRSTLHPTTHLPRLVSQVIDINNVSQFLPINSILPSTSTSPAPATRTQSSTPSALTTPRFNSLSMHLHKALSDRVIIDTIVHSPHYSNPCLHHAIHTNTPKSLQSNKTDEEKQNDILRLQPGDLDSDFEDNIEPLTTSSNISKSTQDKSKSNSTNEPTDPNLEPINKTEQYKEFKKIMTTSSNEIDSTFSTHFQSFLTGKRPKGIPVVYVVKHNPISPHLVLSGAERGDLRLWNTTNGEVVRVLHSNTQNITNTSPQHVQNGYDMNTASHHGDITCIEWLHNGVLALTGSLDCTIKLWATEYGKCLKTFRGHTRGLVDITQHFEKKNIFLSLGKDGKVNVYDTTRKGNDGLFPVYSYTILNENKIDDLGITLSSLIVSPQFSHLVYIITSIGIYSLELPDDITGIDNGIVYQASNNKTGMQPLIALPNLSFGCFNPLDFPSTTSNRTNHMNEIDSEETMSINDKTAPKHKNNIYLGTSSGDIIVLNLEFPSRAADSSKLSTKPGSPELTTPSFPSSLPHSQIETFSFFDEPITAMQWENNQLFITTFAGDVCSLNHNFTQQTHVFTGTDQPMRSLSIVSLATAKVDDDHNFDKKNDETILENTTLTQVVACGDDGVFVWNF